MIASQLSLLISVLCLNVAAGQFNRCSPQQKCIPFNSCPKYSAYVRKPVNQWPPSVQDQAKRSLCKVDWVGGNKVYSVCCDSSGPPPNRPNGMKLLDMSSCGKHTADRIAMGQKAEVFQYPWMALLFNDENDVVCGGTLIADSYVLTAAHCNRERISFVRLGENDLSQGVDCIYTADEDPDCADPPQNIKVASVIAHEKYSPGKKKNDIALVRLATPAKLSFSVNTICLPIGAMLRNPLPNEMIVTGWGYTENHAGIVNVLRYAKLPLVALDKCAAELSRLNNAVRLDDSQVCAGGRNRVDNCAGDSGGPLQYTSQQSTFVQYGIVSFGLNSCGVGNSPGVYTKVTHYIDWILSNLQ